MDVIAYAAAGQVPVSKAVITMATLYKWGDRDAELYISVDDPGFRPGDGIADAGLKIDGYVPWARGPLMLSGNAGNEYFAVCRETDGKTTWEPVETGDLMRSISEDGEYTKLRRVDFEGKLHYQKRRNIIFH
jgi:hypothetical protein